jgi:hypothetical protein
MKNKFLLEKKALPGTHAFLDSDGGGANTGTVCDTADHYRDWLRMESPSGCQAFQYGLKVVIEVVLLDALKTQWDQHGVHW